MIDLLSIGQFFISMVGAGTVGGLASGELSRGLAAHADRKKHLRGLLCDLLELRHGLIGVREVTKAVESQLPEFGAHVSVAMPSLIEPFVNQAKLHEHYESAIVELATLDPLLAYHLRSKNLVATMLGPLSKLALQSPTTIPIAAQAFKIFGDAGTSAIDEAILRVAKELGRKMHREIRKTLECKSEIPEPANQAFALIPQVFQAMQQAQAHPQPQAAKPQEPPNEA